MPLRSWSVRVDRWRLFRLYPMAIEWQAFGLEADIERSKLKFVCPKQRSCSNSTAWMSPNCGPLGNLAHSHSKVRNR
eukprot:2622778-Prymnesium_polylepis.2